MRDQTEIKTIVKEKYGDIAQKATTSCCGSKPSCCGPVEGTDYSIIGDEYTGIEGYVPEADLGLGCGLPTEHAGLKPGQTVVDLGSGAGNDVFVARSIVGDSGKIIGIDMTEEMIALADQNNRKLGYDNIEFKLGEIESLPLESNTTDVVISNCVLNLVPDKGLAYGEIHRILKAGGHFCVSDIVLNGVLPEKLRKSAEMYAGCVAGALQEAEYLKIIETTGFTNIDVKKRSLIDLPDNVLKEYLSAEEIAAYRASDLGIYSITVVGSK
ncbi:MAG: arsenite methyltransferase [Candidatus Marinimicrobia bacterium]|nr:arsenite methyltransferase [Candidatus Neomarinimicrobiota bacterium]